MRFEFATAGRIVFGPGTLREVGPLAAEAGSRALVVVGGQVERAAPLLALLDEQRISFETLQITTEPTVELAAQGVAVARDERCELVIGFGGGSAIDLAKAIAALVTNGGPIVDYLEVIGAGKPITEQPLPFFAVPTTAGTGAEVTRNAVLASREHAVKVSLRSPLMLARAAIVDPALTHSVPPDVTASTGMDALTQVLEPYVSAKANPMVDALCREGMRRAGRSLRRAYHDGDAADAREDMALTSVFGGLALANAALGAVHGFAGPLGGMYPIPHGVACACLLPYVMEANLRALRERAPGHPALARYDEIARLITGDAGATASEGAAWALALSDELRIPRLSTYGVTAADIPDIVEKSARASSMKGNPVVLTTDELAGILERTL